MALHFKIDHYSCSPTQMPCLGILASTLLHKWNHNTALSTVLLSSHLEVFLCEEHSTSRTGFLYELITESNMQGIRKPSAYFLFLYLSAAAVEKLSDLLRIRYLWIPLLHTDTQGSLSIYLFLTLAILQFSTPDAVLINKPHAVAHLPASWDASSNSSWAGTFLIRQGTGIGLCPSVQTRMSLPGSNQPLSKLLLPFPISSVAWSSLLWQ